MKSLFSVSPREAKQFDTTQLRENFLVDQLMQDDTIQLTYTHYDRMIVGGVKPLSNAVSLPNPAELRADYFLERRELGIINVGGDGVVNAGGVDFSLRKMDCLYIGKGTKEVKFTSIDEKAPALFYLLSSPAHHPYPAKVLTKENAMPVQLGALETSNRRTIYKYIHLEGIQSCQLVMGLTILEGGNVWNSIPPHTHTRRMEVYFYFDVPEGQRIFHYMGETNETRHIVMANNEAVVSPPWSTHFGCGTSSYGFIWGMAGENLAYNDMDAVTVPQLR
ncbi:MAG: 5-dehydro-4-deoxy-D-glucuronate isomerase [Chitinophagaceae bacterium]|nr:5-dehydro-4-deoxy-D-glucuronate isomerase [Chitinophagaceae bacterium]